MTPTERGDLAERMIPVALDLATALRYDSPAYVAELFRQLDGEARDWLCVVLAAMVPIDTHSASQLLDWVSFDEHGRTIDAAGARRGLVALASRRAA